MAEDILRRRVEWSPAYDKRTGERGVHGVHGVELRFLLIGPAGATHFVLYTNWHLKPVHDELVCSPFNRTHLFCRPLPADLGYHSYLPQYDDHAAMACEYLDGGQCYYGGSTLQAEPVFWRFVAEGDDAVWSALEALYHSRLKERARHED